MTNAAVRLDMYKSQACMREDKGETNQNEPRRQEIEKNKYPWFDAECKKKRAEYRKLKVCIKVMLIIIPKEREHVRIKSIKKF